MLSSFGSSGWHESSSATSHGISHSLNLTNPKLSPTPPSIRPSNPASVSQQRFGRKRRTSQSPAGANRFISSSEHWSKHNRSNIEISPTRESNWIADCLSCRLPWTKRNGLPVEQSDAHSHRQDRSNLSPSGNRMSTCGTMPFTGARDNAPAFIAAGNASSPVCLPFRP